MPGRVAGGHRRRPPGRPDGGVPAPRPTCPRAGCSSRVDDDRVALPLRHLDRHDLAVEPAGLDRRHGAALRLERERVLALAVDATIARPRSRRSRPSSTGSRPRRGVGLTNRQPSVVSCSSRLPRSQAASGLAMHVRRPGHRLDAAADEHVAVADLDGVGRRVDRLEPAAAQPVDRQAADLDREAGQQDRHAGDVPVILAGLVGAAEDHVLDEGRVDAGAVDDGPQDDRRQVVGSDGCQRAAVAADRGPDGLDDPGVAQRPVEDPGHVRGAASARPRRAPGWTTGAGTGCRP